MSCQADGDVGNALHLVKVHIRIAETVVIIVEGQLNATNDGSKLNSSIYHSNYNSDKIGINDNNIWIISQVDRGMMR